MNDQISRGVAELLDKKNPDGTPFYTDEDVKDVLPLLCAGIVRQLPDIEFPDFVLQSIGEVAARAGVTPETPAEQIWPMLETYYEQRPSSLSKKLDTMLQRVGAEDAHQSMKGLAAIIGAQGAGRGSIASGARPEGTIVAGPLARFATFTKTAK